MLDEILGNPQSILRKFCSNCKWKSLDEFWGGILLGRISKAIFGKFSKEIFGRIQEMGLEFLKEYLEKCLVKFLLIFPIRSKIKDQRFFKEITRDSFWKSYRKSTGILR